MIVSTNLPFSARIIYINKSCVVVKMGGNLKFIGLDEIEDMGSYYEYAKKANQ